MTKDDRVYRGTLNIHKRGEAFGLSIDENGHGEELNVLSLAEALRTLAEMNRNDPKGLRRNIAEIQRQGIID